MVEICITDSKQEKAFMMLSDADMRKKSVCLTFFLNEDPKLYCPDEPSEDKGDILGAFHDFSEMVSFDEFVGYIDGWDIDDELAKDLRRIKEEASEEEVDNLLQIYKGDSVGEYPQKKQYLEEFINGTAKTDMEIRYIDSQLPRLERRGLGLNSSSIP